MEHRSTWWFHNNWLIQCNHHWHLNNLIHLVASLSRRLLFHFPSNKSFHYYQSWCLMSRSAHLPNLVRNGIVAKVKSRKIVINFDFAEKKSKMCKKKYEKLITYWHQWLIWQLVHFPLAMWCWPSACYGSYRSVMLGTN